jgi:hypothetical protein
LMSIRRCQGAERCLRSPDGGVASRGNMPIHVFANKGT